MVRPACDHCPRRDRYRKGTLVARLGGDIAMPDFCHLTAQCPRRDAAGDTCGVYFSDL
jgi:hypothetical protein